MNIFGKKMPDTDVFFKEPRALKLAQAIESGNVKLIREAGSELDINQPHERGMTFLTWAFANFEYESAEALLKLNADPHIETESHSPFSLALRYKDIRWLALLVENGADINIKSDNSPIWFDLLIGGNWE